VKLHLLLLLGVITAIAAHGQLIDKASGKAYKNIVIAPKAPSTVRMAASDLKKYLKAVCNADLSIATGSTEKTGNIYLGLSRELQQAGFTVKGFKPDEFRIVNRDGNLYIWGRDYSGPPVRGINHPWRLQEIYNSKLKLDAFGETGSMYGAYYFLEKFAGIRWYMPGELGTVIPRKDKLEIPRVTISRAPDFTCRNAFFCGFNLDPVDALWYRRAGFGGLYPIQIVHSFNFFTFRNYQKKHPEYFALVDGKRDFGNKCASVGGGNLCLSNPAVAQQWVKDICAYFKANPTEYVYPVVPNDGLGRICGCPKCQAQLNRKAPDAGRFSNYIWGFVNKVAKRVAEKYPDKMVGCLAYEKYLEPPTNIRHLGPNVVVMICKWRNRFGNPNYKRTMRERIEKWRKKCKHIYFWEYYLPRMPWRNLPIVFPHLTSEDVKYMKKINSGGEFIEADPVNWPNSSLPRKMLYPAMQHLDLYITAKLYWDTEQDVDQLLDEYFKLFYGPAEKEMKEFWLLAEKLWIAENKTTSNPSPLGVFPKPDLDKLSALLTAAAGKTESGTVYRKRVELIANEFGIGRRTISQVLRKAPPVLTVPFTETSILPDGSLSEGIYEKIIPQVFVDRAGEAAAYKSYLYAAHDSQNLYLAFINYEPEMNKLQTRCTRRDQDRIWLDDCVDIYLCPDTKNRKQCYQFIINAKGVVWDGRYGFKTSTQPEVSWNSGIKAAVLTQPNRWTVEVKIPLKDIGLSGGAKEIAANFYRIRVAFGGQVYGCWSPIADDHHFTPERFGVLKLDKK